MKWLAILFSLVLSACLTDSDSETNRAPASVAAKSSVINSNETSTDSKSISVSSITSTLSSSSGFLMSSYNENALTELRPVSLIDVNPLGLQPDPSYAAKGTLTIEKFVTKTKFGQVASGLRHKYGCPGAAFYKLDDFLEAAKAFPRFGAEGDDETRIREVMAFFANISHETTGGWAAQVDTEKYAMGLCFVEEVDFEKIDCEDAEFEYECSEYTLEGSNWDPVEGKSYHGRGPMQLSWNYNYGQVGDDLGLDILANPELVSSDGVIAFKTALWFWMKPQFPKPSAHDVMVGAWKYTDTDVDYKREQGFGVTINIINGGIECGVGRPNTTGAANRIGFYKQYLSNYGLEPLYPSRLDCLDQIDFRQH